MNCDMFSGVRRDPTVTLLRVWGLAWGVRAPPGATDKDGRRTIWVDWFHSQAYDRN